MKNWDRNRSFSENISRLLLNKSDSTFIFLTVICVLLLSIGSDDFISRINIHNLSRTAPLYLFIGIGQVFCQLIGGINLAIGSMGGFFSVCFGVLVESHGVHPIVACAVVLLVGMFCGFLIGEIIVKFRLSAVVVTAAMSFVFEGLSQGISRGYPYTEIPQWFTLFGRGRIGAVSYLAIIMIVTCVLFALFFNRFIIGRHILAIGGNETAALMYGINVNRTIVLCYVLSGIFVAIASIFWILRLGSASSQTGQDWFLISLAITTLGGISEGVFSSVGLFFSAILFTVVRNGLILLGINPYYEQCFVGILILGAVCFEKYRRNYAGRAEK